MTVRTRNMRRVRKLNKAAARVVVCSPRSSTPTPIATCCSCCSDHATTTTFKDDFGRAASRGCTSCLARLLVSPSAGPLLGYAGTLAAINGQCESLALLMPRICTAEYLRDHSFEVPDMAIFAGGGGHLTALMRIAEFADEWNVGAVRRGLPLADWKNNAQMCSFLATNGHIDCLRFVLSRRYPWPDRAEFASRMHTYCKYSPQAECVRIAASTHELVYL